MQVPTAGASLTGDLVLPGGARGVVLFAHGSGSSRHSPRNRRIAAGLQAAGFGTLLMDLLTAGEERIDEATGALRFDVPMLAARLTGAVDWLAGTGGTAGLPLVTFGASTGAAAALVTAADRPNRVRAVVSRGGRPDLAGTALGRVRAPTLLIVGGADSRVLELNREAGRRLAARHDIAVIAGATHLFPEPGALEEVIARCVDWLTRELPSGGVSAPAPSRGLGRGRPRA